MPNWNGEFVRQITVTVVGVHLVRYVSGLDVLQAAVKEILFDPTLILDCVRLKPLLLFDVDNGRKEIQFRPHKAFKAFCREDIKVLNCHVGPGPAFYREGRNSVGKSLQLAKKGFSIALCRIDDLGRKIQELWS